MFIFISKLLFSIKLIKYEYKILSIEKGGGFTAKKVPLSLLTPLTSILIKILFIPN